jgi:hypothetical protein
MGTIQFDPEDVQNFDGQPQVRVWLEAKQFTKKERTLGYEPDVRFQPVNLKGMSGRALQVWGDAGAPIVLNDMGVRVISKGEGQG